MMILSHLHYIAITRKAHLTVRENSFEELSKQ
jgi:hypothetical protein